MKFVPVSIALLPCLLLLSACSETVAARGRGGGGSGGSALDTGALPADGSGAGEDTAGEADGSIGDVGGDAGVEDTTLEDTSGADTTPTDTAVDDTGVADTADDVAPADTTPTDTGTVDTTPTDTGTVDTTPTDTGTVDTTPTDTGTIDTGTVDTTPVDTTPVDTTPPLYTCGDAPSYTGQVGGDTAPAGGTPLPVGSRASFTYGNANLSNVALQFPAVDGTPVILAAPTPVIGAVVVATSYLSAAAVPPSQSNFWVADRFGTIEVRLDYTNAANVPWFPVQVGQRINFTVTAVSSYQGVGQIQAATGWELSSGGAGVHILERTSTPLSALDLSELVRVEGLITGGGAACGGTSKCFDLSYGSGRVVTLRTASTFAAIGQCVTFVGPLRQFAGVLQLDAVNFDWLATVY